MGLDRDRESDIRRQDRRREDARRADEKHRQANREWAERLRERRRRAETAKTGQVSSEPRKAAKTAIPAKIRARKPTRARQEREYSVKIRAFLAMNPACQCCQEQGKTPRQATQVHHTAGRDGAMLTRERFWMAVCVECHRKIHAMPAWAHRKGFLLTRGRPIEQTEAEMVEKRGRWVGGG